MTRRRPTAPQLLLAGLRAGGAATFAAPRLGIRQLRLHDDPESAYIVRLFAARNIALAGGLLAAPPRARRTWWQAGIACDALDALAGVLGLQEGREQREALLGTVASLVATCLGIAGLISEAP